MMTNIEKAEKDLFKKSFIALYYQIGKEVEEQRPYGFDLQISDLFQYLYAERRLNTMLTYCDQNDIAIGNYRYDIEDLREKVKRNYKTFQEHYAKYVFKSNDPDKLITKLEDEVSRSGFDKRKIAFLSKLKGNKHKV